MTEFLQLAAVALMIGLIRPVFWLLSMTVFLWLGRKCLPDRVGLALFGHYWRTKRRTLSE